jgi:aminoglycoside 6'-N-acetyltransferase I
VVRDTHLTKTATRVPSWGIVELDPGDGEGRRSAARLLFDGFREFWPGAWPTIEEAEAEVEETLAPGKLGFVARRDPGGAVLGWIGGQPMYDGHVWELHPLVVAERERGKGIGRALVARLEEEVHTLGGLTLWVGTDDEANLTSIGGMDLYPNVLAKLARIENRHGHPFAFYRTLGFELAGVVPDANGFGKPDILMTKRVRRRP